MRSTASRCSFVIPVRFAYDSLALSSPRAPADAVTSPASPRRIDLPRNASALSSPAGFVAPILFANNQPVAPDDVLTSTQSPSRRSTSTGCPYARSATTRSSDVLPARSLALFACTYTVSANAVPQTEARAANATASSTLFVRELIDSIPVRRWRRDSVPLRPVQIHPREIVGSIGLERGLKFHHGV